MFTGITQELLTIKQIERKEGEQDVLRVWLSLPIVHEYNEGDSIMLNGICSTVIKQAEADAVNASVLVEFMHETIQLTTVSHWQLGDEVNCESPATPQTMLSGSIVTGHVDEAGEVVEFKRDSESTILTVRFSPEYRSLLVHKGSITINGVNLTAMHPTDDTVSVHLIPHTVEVTNIKHFTAGTLVNLEFDYIAKLVTQFNKTTS